MHELVCYNLYISMFIVFVNCVCTCMSIIIMYELELHVILE
jgi:hypothetical protein